jgi:hypothetical protein
MNCAQWDRVGADPAQATTRSQIHWFDDGNIILEAGGKLFKVHRGVLSKNSGIFKDMFGLPQPPEQFTIEDCPIVNLSDSEEDVHHFLNVIYIPCVPVTV